MALDQRHILTDFLRSLKAGLGYDTIVIIKDENGKEKFLDLLEVIGDVIAKREYAYEQLVQLVLTGNEKAIKGLKDLIETLGEDIKDFYDELLTEASKKHRPQNQELLWQTKMILIDVVETGASDAIVLLKELLPLDEEHWDMAEYLFKKENDDLISMVKDFIHDRDPNAIEFLEKHLQAGNERAKKIFEELLAEGGSATERMLETLSKLFAEGFGWAARRIKELIMDQDEEVLELVADLARDNDHEALDILEELCSAGNQSALEALTDLVATGNVHAGLLVKVQAEKRQPVFIAIFKDLVAKNNYFGIQLAQTTRKRIVKVASAAA